MPCSTAPTDQDRLSVYDDGLRSIQDLKSLRGVIGPTWSAAGRRPKAPACARRSRTLHVGQALPGLQRLSASSPKRWPSRSTASISARSPSMSIRNVSKWFAALPSSFTAKQKRDRRAHPQGDPRAAALPQRCGSRISDHVAQFGHAVRRRKPAHSPRQPDRLGADRRSLRARRTLDRPASTRQCAAARYAAAAA
jgi:hypothetical protein